MRHQFLLVIALWTAVSCNGNTIFRTIRDSTQWEQNHDQAVMRLAIVHLQNGEIDTAIAEFGALENQDKLVKKFVQSALSNSKVGLPPLARFVCDLTNYDTSYLAMNALYKEMVSNNLLEEKETTILYYYIQNLITMDSNFASLPSALKTNYQEIKDKIFPHKETIMTSVINDIKNKSFDRPKNITQSIWNGKEMFLYDLVKHYFSSSSLTQFTQLYTFAQGLTSWSNVCHALAAMWQELKVIGSEDSMEALAVWSYASEIKWRYDDNAQCTGIANSVAPTYKDILVSEYNNNIKYGKINSIKELHKKYEMKYFFVDYISSQPLHLLQNENFTKVADLINDLPFIDDVCIAVAAVVERFKNSAMLGTFEHFQALQIVKEMKSYHDFPHMIGIGRSKCESAEENTPDIFHKLLYGDTSNCKLINRWSHEPLYCPSLWHIDGIRYRYIYTWTTEEDSEDQYWTLAVSELPYNVYLLNNYREHINLRYVYGTVRGSVDDLDTQYDYFRIRTIDGYILLQPTSDKKYVAAGDDFYNYHRRHVKMLSDPFDHKAQWKLTCN